MRAGRYRPQGARGHRPGIEVVAGTADATSTVEACHRLRPDLVLMDLQMPGGGLGATAAIATELSDTHVLVPGLMAEGLDNARIARRLSLAPKTVRNDVSAVFGKLEVADRPQAIVRARTPGCTVGPAPR